MLWRATEHEPLRGDWDPDVAEAGVGRIVQDALGAHTDALWPGHVLDDVADDQVLSSLYLGSAGMLWGLAKLGVPFDHAGGLALALERFRRRPDLAEEGEDHAPSLLLGESGILVVAGRLGAPCADRSRLSELVRANREHPTWELLWGSPGSMLAARACGLDAEWRESAEILCAHWDAETDMWPHVLAGRPYPHIGPGHGFAGNIHALRGFVADDELRTRIARLLSRTAEREGELVNWPPLDRPFAEQLDKLRVQWCHGAPGIVIALADLMPEELALAGGELTWRAGPLAKGPGLCHGTAGNGYAFLRLHALTGEPIWLERARRFAMHAIAQVDREREAHGRGRYTLWTGDVGVAVYVRACLDGGGGFPSFEVF